MSKWIEDQGADCPSCRSCESFGPREISVGICTQATSDHYGLYVGTFHPACQQHEEQQGWVPCLGQHNWKEQE